MIIGISGPERSFKDGLGSIIATEPEFDYPIYQGFGNMHLFKTPYPWTYLPTSQLLVLLGNHIRQGKKNTLFYISEADRFLSPRRYNDDKQITSLTGIWQGEKMENVLIYNFHPGDPDEPLHGVDLLLRSSTSIKIRIIRFYKEFWTLHFELKNIMLGLEPVECMLNELHKYTSYWNHKEPIV